MAKIWSRLSLVVDSRASIALSLSLYQAPSRPSAPASDILLHNFPSHTLSLSTAVSLSTICSRIDIS